MRRVLTFAVAVLSLSVIVLSCASCAKKGQTIMSRYDDSKVQEGEPIGVDPGDTLAKWNLSRAADFPVDSVCTPEEFRQKWMAVEGITEEDLTARGCEQLLISAAQDGLVYVTWFYCYEKQKDGTWKPVSDLTAIEGTMGRHGVCHDRHAGDETSPGGLYQIGTAFGLEGKPKGLKMPWRDVTENSVWIGKSGKYYNTWQEIDKITDENFTYDSGEHLIDYKGSYDLATAIRFNMYPYKVDGKGAAIFFHVSSSGTAGCIGLKYEDFRRCLLWLDPDDNPYILITGYGK